ncbi:hypothetical protein CABS01_08983 [Colletotrichum abscissum]|uniref:Secreted in xylem 3 n=1 Tax=Colletotrichum abscissum TaxID=1671311 RepID=A0A9P9X4L2_9PEZI|nr:uncharacterized protein CABS01_08983 [Colletotrichum abscissum]KAI3536134.1 hypothetical protein CABS02_12629 [Colletotrichum abscissum]KAK1503594.1 hypothetical protein CABS01_08983 [Colletotrichum abscissum]
MRYLLFFALAVSWVCSVIGLPTDNGNPPPQLQERGLPYCLFPSRRPAPASFTRSFTSDPISRRRGHFGPNAYESAGNSRLNYRIWEDPVGLTGLYTVIDVAAPDGHPALANYEIEVRRIPIATPNAAGECFQTMTLRSGQRGPATVRWRLDASYTYYLTISEV